ncbi:MAG: archaemetzincin family Zn-dependent metalloprotease [Deltaproteobacteria bacterium]|nr:archaemetzincin family Zn-dependent metalloprotease [Deltaproteobacteria bacterium]
MSVLVVPIDLQLTGAQLAVLIERLRRVFAVAVDARPIELDISSAFDRLRGQYDAMRLLHLLVAVKSPTQEKLLLLLEQDLFIPVLSYIFGQAQLGGRAAVVSMYRLRNERYGLPADDALLLGRLEKEAVHELGHTFGLIHCADARCVMHASTYVEEIDFKGDALCADCLTRVRRAR